MLRITGLSKHFGERPVLRQLNLALGSGEVIAIVGESGAGKSTLLNLIAGLDLPDQGQVEIDGMAMFSTAGHNGSLSQDEDRRTRLRRDKIGFVFQAFHILPHLTVGQNVELPLVLSGLSAAERTPRVQNLLSAVGLGTRLADAPSQLSGGEMQRLAIARALVHRPALVLADEPTGNLDAATARTVLKVLLNAIKANGAAGIIVTHSMQAARAADYVLQLADGSLQTKHLGFSEEQHASLVRETGEEDPSAAANSASPTH